MTAAHKLDAISLSFTEEDYKANRPEPRLDTYFEFRVSDANVKRSKNGKNLALTLKVEALDEMASAMFPRWMNVAIPVDIASEKIECPEYAKSMFLKQMAPLFPEHGPYDNVEKDPYSGKNVYYKDGEQISGKEFDLARFASNKKVGAFAKEYAAAWLETGDKVSIDALLEKRFFAILKASKDGKYVNIADMSARAPQDRDVVYTRQEAFKPR